MSASTCVLVVGLICFSNFAAAQQSDQDIAERVLGPQWKQLSRRAGMIFAGMVLTAANRTVATDRPVAGATPTVELSFRVDEAIAGVEPGQILTIHEWAGGWTRQRPMRRGQRFLLFLYPPSRLGFTSPVGGALGQVALDASGKNVSDSKQKTVGAFDSRNRTGVPVDTERVSVVQLDRAIRGAREE